MSSKGMIPNKSFSLAFGENFKELYSDFKRQKTKPSKGKQSTHLKFEELSEIHLFSRGSSVAHRAHQTETGGYTNVIYACKSLRTVHFRQLHNL